MGLGGDVAMLDSWGVPTTGHSKQGLGLYEEAICLFLAYRRDPLKLVDQALTEDPDLVMAHCLRAILFLLSTDVASEPQAQSSLAVAESMACNDRERGHLLATRAWLDGHWDRAADEWEAVLLQFPRDILALQAGHLADFFLGQTGRLRDRIARVLPFWDDTVPAYGFVLGMYAFGLEENDDYRQAEQMAHQALERNPNDAWAVHAVAHVIEMEGRCQEGIRWLSEVEPNWSSQEYMACHTWWHLAMFHLEMESYDEALAIYDKAIRGGHSEVVTDLIDASSLLWRLQLVGMDLSDRWQEISDHWIRTIDDAHYAFNDCHALMALAAAGRTLACETLLSSMERRALRDNCWNTVTTREVGLPACRAIYAFAQGDPDSTVQYLTEIRYQIHRMGGSYAQRDVFTLTLLEAAMRAERWSLAHAFAAERCARKPSSKHNWSLAVRALEGLGDVDRAQEALLQMTRANSQGNRMT